MKARLMLVDDDKVFSKTLSDILKRKNIEVVCVSSPQEALERYVLDKMNYDLLLLDYNFSNINVTGSDLAIKILQKNPDQAIIFMTGFDSVHAVDEMLATGAAKTFVRKGDDVERFLDPVLRTISKIVKIDLNEDELESELKRSAVINSIGLIGRSNELAEIANMVLQVRDFKSRFLIVGESGSGKEKIAQAFQKKGNE